MDKPKPGKVKSWVHHCMAPACGSDPDHTCDLTLQMHCELTIHVRHTTRTLKVHSASHLQPSVGSKLHIYPDLPSPWLTVTWLCFLLSAALSASLPASGLWWQAFCSSWQLSVNRAESKWKLAHQLSWGAIGIVFLQHLSLMAPTTNNVGELEEKKLSP